MTTDEILEVFKLITKNAAFKNTVFITTYDKNYINGMLEQNLCVPQKQRFSDKYFNMEIDLPEGDGKIRKNIKVVELHNPNNLLVADEFQPISNEIDNLLYNNFMLRA